MSEPATETKIVQRHNNDVMQFVAAYIDNLKIELEQTPEDAEILAGLAAHTLQEEFGGDNFYVSTGHFWFKGEVARRIFKRWQAGVSIENLADEFELTTRRIRQIIEKIRDSNFKAKQGKLF
jgi:Mor family transcriptional regulator